ncbi:hypothetical protein [Diaminobutyricimonas sp. TR449]|uniref:hypothetical protein n=1 Tax=Diaminobutyricimonas sp. TR449 TaxID=2708076 RepID=UPI00141DA7FD|nr:hypothetical protein [Diaminobutyricimonas sp. TR449]
MVNLVEKLSELIPAGLGVKKNYGDPIIVGGVELVPVSLVWFGFGGGSDESSETGEGAGGGGGGGVSVPIGAYVPGPDGPVFRPNVIAAMAVGIPLVAAVGTALSKIVKALKK